MLSCDSHSTRACLAGILRGQDGAGQVRCSSRVPVEQVRMAAGLPVQRASTARSLVASVEWLTRLQTCRTTSHHPTDYRAVGAGWARSRAGGACQSSRLKCSAAHPSIGSPFATRSTVAVSSVRDDGHLDPPHGHGNPISCSRVVRHRCDALALANLVGHVLPTAHQEVEERA